MFEAPEKEVILGEHHKWENLYNAVILPVVFYGCETWYLTLREEQRLRVFENKELKKIFGV